MRTPLEHLAEAVQKARTDAMYANIVVSVVGDIFFPWMKLPGVSMLVEGITAHFLKREAAEGIGQALRRASDDLARNTVWLKGQVVAGAAPVGTTLRPVAIDEKLKLASGVRIPFPLILRLKPPAPPWTFRDKEHYLAVFRSGLTAEGYAALQRSRRAPPPRTPGMKYGAWG